MSILSKRLALASMFLLCAQVSRAQTADEVIEKCLTALGGRAAFAKLTSQSATRHHRPVDAGRRRVRLDRDPERPAEQVPDADQG